MLRLLLLGFPKDGAGCVCTDSSLSLQRSLDTCELVSDSGLVSEMHLRSDFVTEELDGLGCCELAFSLVLLAELFGLVLDAYLYETFAECDGLIRL